MSRLNTRLDRLEKVQAASEPVVIKVYFYDDDFVTDLQGGKWTRAEFDALPRDPDDVTIKVKYDEHKTENNPA